MDVIRDEIRDAIEKELVGANERFPLFASPHEAIAVIAEEMDEAHDAMKEACKHFDLAWSAVKSNSHSVLQCVTRLMFAAEHLAIEACQVAAMCEKTVQSAEGWKNGTN